MRPLVEHLAKVVCQVKRRSTIDRVFIFPIGRGDDLLVLDSLFEPGQSNRFEPLERQRSVVGCLLGIPRCLRTQMGHWNEHIKGAFARRRKTRVAHASILNVKGRLGGQALLLLDLT